MRFNCIYALYSTRGSFRFACVRRKIPAASSELAKESFGAQPSALRADSDTQNFRVIDEEARDG